MPKGLSEVINRRTGNAMAKRKRKKMINSGLQKNYTEN